MGALIDFFKTGRIHKSPEKYVRQVIRIAKKIKEDLPEVYDTGKAKNVIRLLKLILKFDLDQLVILKQEKWSENLIVACRDIHTITQIALADIEEKYEFTRVMEIVDKIIALESLLINKEISQSLNVPSPKVRKIMLLSANEAAARGFLFRGVTPTEYILVHQGAPLTAESPGGTADLVDHILAGSTHKETPFISLTTDANTARHFGKVLIVDRKRLVGHLYSPNEIDGILNRAGRRGFTAKRLRRKNDEYILGPFKGSKAMIPKEAVLN